MSELTYQDNYGDELTVRTNPDADVAYVEADEGGTSTQLEFDKDRLATIACEVLSNLGVIATPEQLVSDLNVAELTATADKREAWNQAAVSNAQLLGLGVQFRYVKNEAAEPVHRELSRVTDVIETSEGHALVVGFDSDRVDYRSYRLDRIRGYVSALNNA